MDIDDIDIKEIVSIAKDAGAAIMEIYSSSDHGTEMKKDERNYVSPLTKADKASNEVIIASLEKYALPILSEESAKVPYEERKHWKEFFLIDPMDGTKEFVSRNGNFTVNIALIKDNKPIKGVVYVPAKDICYYSDGTKAFKDGVIIYKKDNKNNKKSEEKLKVVASKSHLNQETKDYIASLGDVEFVSIGSSLKFCLVAEGKADIYPRLGPTMEWDTAAAHAIVNAAGAKVYKWDSEEELEYNKQDLHNPFFLVK